MKPLVKFISAVLFALFLIAVGIFGYSDKNSGKEAEGNEEDLSVTLSAAVASVYEVSESSASGYFWNCNNELRYFDSISELILALPDGASVNFSDVEIKEQVSISRNIKISGKLTALADIRVNSALTSSANIVFKGGSLIIEEGEVNLCGGEVLAEEAAALVLTTDKSKLFCKEADLKSLCNDYTLRIEAGYAQIKGGEIYSKYASGVYNLASLVLGQGVQFSCYAYSVETAAAISLSAGESVFAGEASVLWLGEIIRGTSTPVYKNSGDISGIKLYGNGAEELSPVAFAGGEWRLYLPFTAEYFIGGKIISKNEFLKDELLSPLVPEERIGYSFAGWYKDESLGALYPFGQAPNADIKLYGKYKLSEPTYSAGGLKFVFDGEKRDLSLFSVSHPLEEQGSFLFKWYKNGEFTGVSTKNIPITYVKDSGEYSCEITFVFGDDFVVLTTAPITVSVSPKEIPLPTIAPKEYTSYHLIADVADSPYYTVMNNGGISAGEYEVVLKLRDGENYRFVGCDDCNVSLNFEILKAKNSFLSEIKVKDAFEGNVPEVIASPKFGSCKYYYSECSIGQWSTQTPLLAGKYYLLAVVEECENYEFLSSEPIQFTVLEEKAVGIRVDTPPNKTAYRAFESFDFSGAVFSVSYNSGRVELLSYSELEVKYSSGNTFRYADSAVKICYGDVSVPVAVTVGYAEYDLSSLVFQDKTVVYNGERHTIIPTGRVIGLDGIPLEYTISGGGENSGVYEVSLSFISKSPDYSTPKSKTATLTVEKCRVTANYSPLTFVYDKTEKLPLATVTLLNGYKKNIKLTGAGINAGEYTATAFIEEENYELINPTVSFTVLKADIDVSCAGWSESELIYNGEVITVVLEDLPCEVKVVGYINASATNAGEYVARAVLSYDKQNYNCPDEISASWRILKADYDMSGVNFEDGIYIYDGNPHYPIIRGELPTGLDAIPLTYSFDRGIVDVNQSGVITVRFNSESENYNIPQPLYVTVEITPQPISVSWGEMAFVYDGKFHAPVAYSDLAELEVVGGGENAGEYTVIAKSLNPNYTVDNGTALLRIEKRANSWLVLPSAADVFEGDLASVSGESEFGEIEVRYYSDIEMNNEVSGPFSPGSYYMRAFVREGDNYLALEYNPIAFRVIKIVPVELVANLKVGEIVAMRKIQSQEIDAYFINNDGSKTPLALPQLEILYENGDFPVFGDRFIMVCANEFCATVPARVVKADYDMSYATWNDKQHVYDGEVKYAYLTGLPEGVEVVSYALNSGILAGSYKLSANLSYDKVNYNPPAVPDAWLVIDKKELKLPDIKTSFVYNGKLQAPDIDGGEIYDVLVTTGSGVGFYKITFRLLDSQNYRFSEGMNEIYYEITPRQLELKINPDRESYTVISGEIIEGDELGISFEQVDGELYIRWQNKNYLIIQEPFAVKRESSSVGIIALIIGIILIILLAVILILRKKRLKAMLVSANGASESKPAALPNSASKIESTILAVDEAHANYLISDDMVKGIVKKSDEVIKTSGRGRCFVNIDTVSRSFKSADVVDINSMKEKGIIPKDALFVKVLGGGIIDKPLTVKANRFSASAIKMIALTGGEARECKTTRKKDS